MSKKNCNFFRTIKKEMLLKQKKSFSESNFQIKRQFGIKRMKRKTEIKTNSKTFSLSTRSRWRWGKTLLNFWWNRLKTSDGDLRVSQGCCCCTRRRRHRHRCCCCCRRRRCTSSREGKWSRRNSQKIFCTWKCFLFVETYF